RLISGDKVWREGCPSLLCVSITNLLAGALNPLKQLRRVHLVRRRCLIRIRRGEPDLPLGGNLAILKVDRAILEVQRAGVEMQTALFAPRTRRQPGDELVERGAILVGQRVTVDETDRGRVAVVDVVPVRTDPDPRRLPGPFHHLLDRLQVDRAPVEVWHAEADVRRFGAGALE